jgi:hypothetical protein
MMMVSVVSGVMLGLRKRKSLAQARMVWRQRTRKWMWRTLWTHSIDDARAHGAGGALRDETTMSEPHKHGNQKRKAKEPQTKKKCEEE